MVRPPRSHRRSWRLRLVLACAVFLPLSMIPVLVGMSLARIHDYEPRVGIWLRVTGVIMSVTNPCSNRSRTVIRYGVGDQTYEGAAVSSTVGVTCTHGGPGDPVSLSVNPDDPTHFMGGTPEDQLERARHKLVSGPASFVGMAAFAACVAFALLRWRGKPSELESPRDD